MKVIIILIIDLVNAVTLCKNEEPPLPIASAIYWYTRVASNGRNYFPSIFSILLTMILLFIYWFRLSVRFVM